MKARLLFILLLLLPWVAPAQVVIKSESFETDGEGVAGRYTSNTFTGGTSGSTAVRANQYFLRASASTPPANWSVNPVSGGTLEGSSFWASEGARGPAGIFDRPAGTVTLAAATVTGYSNLKVRVAFMDARGGVDNWEFNDTVKVQVRFDGIGSWTTVGQFAGSSQSTQGRLQQDFDRNGKGYDETTVEVLTTTMKDYEFGVTGSGSTLQVRIVVSQDGVQEELGFDNIRVVGTVASSAAPALANIESGPLSYAEGDAPKTITSTLTLTDTDSPNLSGATVSITDGYLNGQDVLAFTNQNGITGNWVASTGTLTLTGTASVAFYQAALRTVTYQNTNTTNATAGSRTVTFSAKDQANVGSNSVSRTIAVTAALLGAASIPYTEDFETDGEGTRYASNTFNAVNGLAFVRTNLNPFNSGATTFTGVSGSYRWDGSGTNTASNPDPRRIGILETRQVDATYYSNLHFQVKLGASQNQWESADHLKLYYRTGGSAGTWTIFASFRGNSTADGQLRRDANPADLSTLPTGAELTPALTNFDFALPAAVNGQQVDFRFELSTNDSREEVAWDLIQVTGTLNNAPTDIALSASTVAENQPSGTPVGNFTSSDPDAGQTFTYALATGTGSTDNASFTIVGNQLRTAASFNFEAKSSYSIRVRTTDNGTPNRSYEEVFTITVTNVNEAPSISPQTFSINENAANGTTVGTVAASDPDAGTTLTYSITAGNTGSAFTFVGNFLRVNNSAALDFETTPTFALTVQVSDGALTSSATITVNLNNVDDTPPTIAFTAPTTTTTSPIAVTVTFSEIVTNFIQTDVTVTNGSATSFSGSGTTYTLSITPAAPGTVTVSIAANVAQDGAGNGNVAASTSISYNPPTTVSSINRANASPTNAGSVNFTVTFARSVTGVNTGNFSLTPSVGVTGASITSVSGSGTTYTVVVNTGSGSGTLSLNMQNATGVDPGVSNLPYTSGQSYTIDKTAPAAPVVQVPANNSTITTSTPTYSGTAEPNSTVTLTVDGGALGSTTASGTGTWSLAQSPGLADGMHTVVATATDAAGNTGANSAAITFTVLATTPTDISLSNASVLENQPAGTAVGMLTATANTAGQTYTYALVTGTGSTGNGAFSIVGTELRTASVLDFEAQSSYSVRVRATNAQNQFIEEVFTISVTNVANAAYVSSTTEQITRGVVAGSTNQAILRISVVTNGNTDELLTATSFTFTTAGTTVPANASAARIYSSGTSATFATTTLFGSATAPGTGSILLSGSQVLQPGTNYFWLAYDVAATAVAGNLLDGTLPALTVGGINQTPTVTAPAGARPVVAPSTAAGTALSFSGTAAGYVDLGTGNANLVLGQEYTMEIWVKPTPTGSTSTLNGVLGYEPSTPSQRSPYISIAENNRVEAGYGNGNFAVTALSSTNAITTGQWNHIVVTFNGSTLSLYINGALRSQTTGGGASVNTAVRYVGLLKTSATSYFKGEVEEVAMWTRTLSLDEIRLRRHLLLGGTENGLTSYVQFNEGSGNVTDIISGASGPLTGTGVTRMTSTAPVGSGVSSLQTLTGPGSANFTGTGVAINFTGGSGTFTTTVARLSGKPQGTQPSGLSRYYNEAYWIINKYDAGTFTNAAVTYSLSAGALSAADAADPAGTLRLLRRSSNADGAFDASIAATAANAAGSTVTFNVNSFSQTVIGTLGTSPLPVELVRFAAARRGADALLRWTTASELNCAYFEVESSLDGRSFRPVGRITGAGTTTQVRNYELVDADLARYAASLVYYRLRQVDTDGTAHLSTIVPLKLSSDPGQVVTAVVFPNPAADQLTVRLEGLSAGPVQARLYNAQGKLVLTLEQLSGGQAVLDLSASVRHLPTGVYSLRLVLPDRVLHRPVVVSH
ncbi:cadherin domain-containing protein [Hymenobacter sp. BT175]|uniref:cadherin domain-containing protein n=1 Tax=Hymenobacter translucens TaxID=2886507 RepID=UPI001D0EBB14|nr:cadherin domain-containing protein [Hymenobacter translucens]MCC2546272.1 cadherin domain-containing protein [Hymenobacter translucens]